MTPGVAAAICLTLRRFSDIEIAAMNNALTGFGRLQPENVAFAKAREEQLVKESGAPGFELEDLLAALTAEIDRRPAFGLMGAG